MRVLALAADYDGTLATDGRVPDSTVAALEQLKESGRRLLLVTGRELDDLQRAFPRLSLFDRVVAENGALIHRPQSREEALLAERPPARFVEALRGKGMPISIGRAIVATREPHEAEVVESIRALGLELQVIFNKGAVMVLPTGVNKRTGFLAALEELGLSQHDAVAVGDAENDHAFVSACECGVAVANALPMLKERADLVTRGARGQGVEELIARILEDDLASLAPGLSRHSILLGTRRDGSEVRLSPHGTRLLVAGPSGSGKTTAAAGVLEGLLEGGYQCCLVDPEGDYECSRLTEMRARTGRPHWLAVDEAHHLLPSGWAPAPQL